MKRAISIGCFALLTFGSLGSAAAEEGIECYPPCREGYICRPSTGECVSPCNPPCRQGYVCVPERRECVSPCNPPCDPGQTCTEAGECIGGTAAAAGAATAETGVPKPEAGDRRFRLGFLGRFGFGGKQKLKFAGGGEQEYDADVTLGYTLRFEKPPAKYVSVGLDLSNYWVRAKGDPERDLFTDISVLVKPRYPVVVGKKHRELEAYLNLLIGGSLGVFDSANGWPETFGGGFNFNIGPGFQAFVASRTALILELGYAYTWIKLGDTTVILGQGLLRVGIAGAF